MKATLSRRWNTLVLALWCGLLVAPPLAQMLKPAREAPLENRTLAPAVTWPRSLDEWASWPSRAQAWVRDHFGLRGVLLEANHRWRYQAFGTFLSPDLTVGKADQVFYGVFGTTPGGSLRVLCGAGRVSLPAVGRDVTRLMAGSRAGGPRSHLLMVPDKSTLRADKLPQWLQEECAGGTPPTPFLVDLLAGQVETAGRVYYPLDLMRRADAQAPVYHPWNLHWDFHGAALAADWLARDQWGMARRYEVALEPRVTDFDVRGFAPGVRHQDITQMPVYPDSRVLVCRNDPVCFPEFPAEAALLFQVARVRSAWQMPPGQRRPTLVIIGDSFGDAIVDPLARYFAEVWYLSMNRLSRLTPAQRQRVNHVIHQFSPDVLLHVYHEGTVLVAHDTYLRRINGLLDPVPSK